jgi:hypothetical protein
MLSAYNRTLDTFVEYFGFGIPPVAELIAKLPNAEKCTNYEGIDASARLERQKRKKRRLEFEQHQQALLFEQELQPRIGLLLPLFFFNHHSFRLN